ncbi:Cerato-platanin-domain-containing protein [Suillus subaureus]|uniref:Cerato-platanin-domain-containing protein n=1 Tax=Suillus subaureus TaxID=48587 RepID=A0A9P7EMN6_9AGAM|nr:Cerato-platanin-domain-containing protein [Suillus subaureus]KAG1825549.1 Cerato-platanin-domain-containing protein [Suillus subaureus]
MKFSSVLFSFSISVFVLSSLAQPTETLSYDTTYDDASLSLSSIACSDGTNGLETKGYTTLESLPTFPNVGGVYTVAGWNSAATAMNTLTGNLAAELGRVDVTATQVNASVCGL